VFKMFITYEYYTETYKGDKLTQEQFAKQAPKACSLISDATMLRISDSTINNYPLQIIDVVKRCACDLSEKYYDFDQIYNNITNVVSGKSNGNVLFERSGLAEIRYGYSEGIIKKFTDPVEFKRFLLDTIHEYLSPQLVNGIVYNLTSKVMSNSKCCLCSII